MTEQKEGLHNDASLLESGNKAQAIETDVLLRKHREGVTTARVAVTVPIQRNLGNYEHMLKSFRFEEDCRPEDKEATAAALEALGTKFGRKFNADIDRYLLSRSGASSTHGQNQSF